MGKRRTVEDHSPDQDEAVRQPPHLCSQITLLAALARLEDSLPDPATQEGKAIGGRYAQ